MSEDSTSLRTGRISSRWTAHRGASAAQLLLVLVISLFIAETSIMLLLPLLVGNASPLLRAVLDPLLLIGTVFPLLYLYFYRPLHDDIAEKMAAEQALRDSEARLKEAQHIARLGNWELDVPSGRIWWSDETYRIFGIDAGTPITIETFLGYIHPDDRQPTETLINAAIAERAGHWQADYRITLPAGEVRYLHEEAISVLNSTGDVARRIGTVQDITEQKLTQQAIFTLIEAVSGKTDVEFFCTLVQSLATTLSVDYAFVGELTPDMKHVRTITLYAHGQFQENVEYALADTPCENVIGKSLCIYANGVQETFPKDHLLVTMGVTSYIGAPLCTSSGKAIGIMAALDSSPIKNTRFASFVFNLFTIRAASELERMRGDRDLKQQQAFTEAIIEGTSSGILVVDRKGTVLKVNRAGAEILGHSAEDMLEGNITALYPDTRAFLDASSSMSREVTVLRPDGSEVPIGFANSILPNVPGHGTVIIVLFRDLSEIKKLQLENRRKEHFEAVSKVVSGVAHEVRNPLFGISSIGQILEREIEAPQHRALISAMLKETTRMKNLIEELLLYTRPSRLDIRQIDLGILFVELEYHLAGKRDGIQIHIEPPSQATVRADRDKITQVILNVCQNAIDAARTEVSVKARVNGDRCEIIIEDDGPGISAANRERLFEPFFTTKKGGTGLGLPICRKLVEDHGGTLELNSVEGTGTTVTLSFRK